MKNEIMYQQGDVLIKSCANIPKSASILDPTRPNKTVLAEGEVTGHFHGMDSSTTALLEHEGKTYLRVDKDTDVTHQEHNTITIPKGDYLIGIVQEYDHFAEEARNVAD